MYIAGRARVLTENRDGSESCFAEFGEKVARMGAFEEFLGPELLNGRSRPHLNECSKVLGK